jgi:hypothetical protein
MRRIRFNTTQTQIFFVVVVLALLVALPAASQEAETSPPAEATEPAPEASAIGDAPLVGEEAAANEGPLAPDLDEAGEDGEASVIEAKTQPILTEADYAAVPEAVHPQLDAVDAALAQLSETVASSKDPAALRAAAKTAMNDIQTSRRTLEYFGIRVVERDGELVNVLEEKIGVPASNALGAIIGDATAIERGLRYCLDLFPNSCHQRLRGNLDQLANFDASSDLALPEDKVRIASTNTLGLAALVVAYLPDPKPPTPRKPLLTGDEDIDIQRSTQIAKENDEAMLDFLKYRVQVQQARLPHTIVNNALATGDLVDMITTPRKYTDKEGKKQKIVRDTTKPLRGPSDPTDIVRPSDLWALIVKLDAEDEAFRRSRVGTVAATATE